MFNKFFLSTIIAFSLFTSTYPLLIPGVCEGDNSKISACKGIDVINSKYQAMTKDANLSPIAEFCSERATNIGVNGTYACIHLDHAIRNAVKFNQLKAEIEQLEKETDNSEPNQTKSDERTWKIKQAKHDLRKLTPHHKLDNYADAMGPEFAKISHVFEQAQQNARYGFLRTRKADDKACEIEKEIFNNIFKNSKKS
jgi:hypothetical protein